MQTYTPLPIALSRIAAQPSVSARIVNCSRLRKRPVLPALSLSFFGTLVASSVTGPSKKDTSFSITRLPPSVTFSPPERQGAMDRDRDIAPMPAALILAQVAVEAYG